MDVRLLLEAPEVRLGALAPYVRLERQRADRGVNGEMAPFVSGACTDWRIKHHRWRPKTLLVMKKNKTKKKHPPFTQFQY